MSGTYEPPISEVGSTLTLGKEPETFPGIQGYAVMNGEEIWIPLVIGDGTGQVGKFLDKLSPRCALVNVCNPKLTAMLARRGWQMSLEDAGVGVWR